MSLYEPLLERDVAGIRRAVREYRASHTLEDLFNEVTRFAVLAYAPSQHGKHAVAACLSAFDVGLSDEILTECAIYAALSRQPWSEPPIADPPEPAERGDIDELRAAIAAGDRLRAERWLAKRLEDPQPDLFLAATDTFEDLGHKLVIAQAAWRLAAMFPARFATLRIAVWEMTAYQGEQYEEQGVALDAETLLGRLIDEMIATNGDIVSAHQIFLLDAALQTENELVMRRTRDYLTTICGAPAPSPAESAAGGGGAPRPYALGRDYGALLRCHAIARRLGPRFPSLNFAAVIAAAEYNLEHTSSFEEFSFA